MKIYLAGSVPKGDENAKTYYNWRTEWAKELATILPDARIIEPYDRNINEEDFLLVVGADSRHIKYADLIIVNATEKLGAGTAIELAVAKYFTKPVITILPKDSHHRRSNVVFHGKLVKDWIHPFIFTFSDYVLENIQQIDGIKDKLNTNIKDITIIDNAITYAESH